MLCQYIVIVMHESIPEVTIPPGNLPDRQGREFAFHHFMYVHRGRVLLYRKSPTISPVLIYFRKRFLMGLYKGGGAYIRVGLYMDNLLC